MTGRPCITGNDEATAKLIREVEEKGATDKETLGEEVEKLPELTTVGKEVRGARELACSPRSMELQSGGALVDLDTGTRCAQMEWLGVEFTHLRGGMGCWSEGKAYL